MERLDTVTARVLADLRSRMDKEAGGFAASGQLAPGRTARGGKPGSSHAKRETALQREPKGGGATRLLGRPGDQLWE